MPTAKKAPLYRVQAQSDHLTLTREVRASNVRTAIARALAGSLIANLRVGAAVELRVVKLDAGVRSASGR